MINQYSQLSMAAPKNSALYSKCCTSDWMNSQCNQMTQNNVICDYHNIAEKNRRRITDLMPAQTRRNCKKK